MPVISDELIWLKGPLAPGPRYMLYPLMLDELLAVQFRATLCTEAGVPVPLKESTVGELEALLTNEAVPETAPVACGVNVAVTCKVLPAVRVAGTVMPLNVNSELLRLTEEIVTLAPVALSVAGRLALVPTTTLPKARLVGLTANCPAAVPVPESGIFKVGLDAFEVIARLPLALPADWGVKMTLKVTLCPDVSVTGGLRPLMLNPVPVTVS